MRVGYARVSTIDQSPELQLEALRRTGCEKVFTEKASGAKDNRPELARILSDVLRAGDTLIVWKLDRLARSFKKLIATAEELEREKIGLVSLTKSIDTTTPGGMLTLHVFGAIAQFERALTGLKRIMEVVADGGVPMSVLLVDHPRLRNDPRRRRWRRSATAPPSSTMKGSGQTIAATTSSGCSASARRKGPRWPTSWMRTPWSCSPRGSHTAPDRDYPRVRAGVSGRRQARHGRRRGAGTQPGDRRPGTDAH